MSRCELEFYGGRGDDFDDLEGVDPLVVQLLGWVVSCVILGAEPDPITFLVPGGHLVVPVIVVGHLVCCML